MNAIQALKLRLGIARALARREAGHWPWRAEALARDALNRRRYRLLSEDELRRTRRSDTVFVFGSGYSINDLTPPEIADFERHQTISFNWFVHQRFVRVDYHLLREISPSAFDSAGWGDEVAEYFRLIRESPHYREAVFLVQSGFRALEGNRAIGYRLLPEGASVFRWRSVRGRRRLGRSFADGLSHAYATLDECVNFAYLLGWRRIVLVGVDLYDRRYFWLGPEETRGGDERRGGSHAQPHSRADSGMVEMLGEWSEELAKAGVELLVYNPRSLLRRVLPVYGRL